MSEVLTFQRPARSRLPLGGYAIDVLVYATLTAILMVAVLAMTASRDAGALSQAWHERALTGPQRVFLSMECPKFDQAALFAELSRQGEILGADRPAALGSETARGPRVTVAPMSARAFRSGAPVAADPRLVLLDLVLTPAHGNIFILDIHGILASSGCEWVSAHVMPDRAGPAMAASLITSGRFSTATLLGLMLASVGAAILAWGLRARRLPRNLPQRPLAASLRFAILAAFGLQVFVVGASHALSHWGIAPAPSNIEPIRALHAAYPASTLLLVLVLVPLAEELFFRDLLLRRFAIAGRPVIGLLLSAAFFATLHEMTPNPTGVAAHIAALLLYLALGLGFGAIYLRTGRLAAVILAHVAVNAVGITGLLWVPQA